MAEAGCFSVSARTVLWILVFSGFAVNYMIRINMNIAIVAMVRGSGSGAGARGGGAAKPSGVCTNLKLQEANNTSARAAETVTPTSWLGTTAAIPLANATSAPAAGPSPGPSPGVETGFDWDARQQGLVLGAFFWLHWATQVPGGILARRYGTKLVFGLANFIPVLLSFLLPMASSWGYQGVMVIRLLQGLIAGFAWPSMHNMTAQWVPPNERSRFVTAYLGSSVGAALTFPLCGQLIHSWGWESVFYTCGVVGTLWYVLWVFLVFDSPSKHPRISVEEVTYIANAIGKSVSAKKISTPWRAILTSRAVWMNIVAQWGGVFGLFTIMTQAPTYFRYIHGWDIRMTGVFSGLPHLLRMLWASVFSEVGDFLLRRNILSRTNVRKLATFFCDVVQGLLVVCLMFSGCDSLGAIIFLTAATAIHGSVSSGPLASMVDVSPNFASIILGISGMISVLPGFISPLIVGYFTYKNQTVEQWRKVFGVTAAQLIVCGVLYVCFAQSDLQSWNSPRSETEKAELENGKSQELQPLKEKDSQSESKKKESKMVSNGR